MSNLTGKFISNTYQKLLQLDNANGANGDAILDIPDAISTTKYNLLNGLGQNVPYLVIDNTFNGDGSVFLKNTVKDPDSLWGIQIENSDDTYGSSGLNFWRPFGSVNPGNKYLFLKNTGTTWVGFQSQDIFDDVIEYSIRPGSTPPANYQGTYTLYVSDGILVKGVARQINANPPTESLAVGAPTNGSGIGNTRTHQKLKLGDDMEDGSNSQLSIISNNSRLQIYGSASNTISVVDNNFNFYMQEYNGGSLPSGSQYHPFKTLRYKYAAPFNSDRTRRITDSDNTTFFSTNEWSAHITGFFMNGDSFGQDAEAVTAIMVDVSGSWAIKFNIPTITYLPKRFVFDVLLIRKGFYDDLRNLDGNQINVGGSNLDPLIPLI